MASNSARKTDNIRYLNTGPGPASYSYVSDHSFDSLKAHQESQLSTEPSIMTKIREKIKAKDDQSFRKRVIKKSDPSKIGPGTYSIEKHFARKPVNTSQAVFQSKVQKLDNKELIRHASQVPAVGRYDLSKSPMNDRSRSVGPTSSFFPTVVRDLIMANDYQKVKDQIIYEKPDKAKIRILGQLREIIPGPGDYDVNESYLRLKKLKPINRKGGQIAAQGEIRFLAKDLKIGQPGPGQYKSRSEFEVEKYGVYNSVFMSETRRAKMQQQEYSGSQEPLEVSIAPPKESFHCNEKNIWLI